MIRLLGGATLDDALNAVEIVVSEELPIVTPEQPSARRDGSLNWPNQVNFEAPRVPALPATYPLDLRCPAGTTPTAAWHEPNSAYPGRDQFYSIDASVHTETETVQLAVRSRQGTTPAYTYVQVYVLCKRTPSK